ncbi:DUF2129 domain-containing protein [Streptococcus sp. DD13]|uniref:DUF2129 domain-containing protein n=1 Tax=Streptococcus sp. DD13 TaxID=1777881 RepID=UPI0007976E67|nr:DUF2129 domain-containing protein [Streptococcus sp. DD13]KXT78482.1 hypothetical protein STRDD13_00684 [Streptococcus sp. DD13]
MWEKINRNGLIVYLHYNRDVRKLTKYGDILYHSKKMRYVLLYLKQEELEDTQALLETEKFVKKVLPSYQKEIDKDFVGNLLR